MHMKLNNHVHVYEIKSMPMSLNIENLKFAMFEGYAWECKCTSL